MRLNELDTAGKVTKVVFAFGRLNPPHHGHHAMIHTLQKAAQEHGADWYLFVSSKHDTDKNPLTYEQKCYWIRTLFPETAGHLVEDSSIKTPLVAATWLYKKGYRSATFVAGADDMEAYSKMIQSGNEHGIKNPEAVKAGKGFVFDPLDFAISPRLGSATNARASVKSNDPEAFARSILGPKIANPQLLNAVETQLFPMVRKGMALESVNESLISEIEAIDDYGKRISSGEINRNVKYKIDELGPGKLFATVGGLRLFLMQDPEYTHELFFYLIDSANKPVGYFAFTQEDKAWHPDISKISSEYQGGGLGLQVYKALIQKGMMLRSGNQQSPGGQKLWNELSDTPGILVYAARPTKNKNKFDYSLVEPGDAGHVLADFDVYDKEGQFTGKKYEELEKYMQAIMDATKGKVAWDHNGKLKIASGANANMVVKAKQLDAKRKRLTDKAESNYGDSFLIAIADRNKIKESKELLDKPTPTVADLAEKYHCSLLMVQQALDRGIKVEQEHTSDTRVAREIALDHLGERLDYYERLKKVEENFADGKGPGRPGDSQRLGIPKGATIAQLEKASHAAGRKGQLARWQLNMRRGKKRASEDGAFAFGGGSGGNADAGPLIDRQVAIMPWDKETPIVSEVADQPYRYMLAKRTVIGSQYTFQTDTGTRMIVAMRLEKLSDGAYEVEIGFSDLSDSANPIIGITGKGDAFRVFATVAAIIKEYFAKTKANIRLVIFKGKSDEPSRIRLYDRLAQQLPKIIPGFTFKGAGLDGVDLKVYYFERATDESLEETLKKVKGKWALVSRHDPSKVLQYYHGSGHPSKDWVSKVERRVHSFEAEEQSVKPRVYLDMDGVLADFFGEWARLSGVDHYKDIDNAEDKLQLVRDHPTFWVDLPLLPHAKDLIKLVVENFGEYRICTKPLEGDERCRQGKLDWIKNNLMDMLPADVIFAEDKSQYAMLDGIPCILVDDYGKNINSWKAAGGIGIKYEPANFNQVSNILKSMSKTGVVK